MIKRRFFHAGWIVSGGEVYCSQCGAKFTVQSPYWKSLLSENPCTIPLASVLCDEEKGLQWLISVWNCQAELMCIGPDGLYRKVFIAPDVREQVEALILEAVEKEGGLNLSGIYSPPDSLIPLLEGGKIKVQEE